MSDITRSHPVVGVVGLGAMGSRFAERLLRSGFEVRGFNRSADRAPWLDPLGLIRDTSPAELAAGADFVVMMLWDTEAVDGILNGENGLLEGVRPGSVIVDFSTIEPEASALFAAQTMAHGATFLDTPVSGSLDRAETGELLVMVGGPAKQLERVMPVLRILARRVIHVGERNGSGLVLKLAINQQVANQLVGWGEAIALTDSFGVDCALASEIMLDSVIASPMLSYRVPFSFEEPEEVWASAEQLRKDVAYAQGVTSGHPRASSIALELLDAVIASGRGDKEAAELLIEARDSVTARERVARAAAAVHEETVSR
jgi:3-hydroxyisobutyrate dehydrogenase-like beta-hydroxyacid dehydrogenase